MCLGVPMTVVSCDGPTALCERRGEQRRVSVLLIGEVAVGAQVLVFIDNAVRLLDPVEARLIEDALDGLAAALEGRAVRSSVRRPDRSRAATAGIFAQPGHTARLSGAPRCADCAAHATNGGARVTAI